MCTFWWLIEYWTLIDIGSPVNLYTISGSTTSNDLFPIFFISLKPCHLPNSEPLFSVQSIFFFFFFCSFGFSLPENSNTSKNKIWQIKHKTRTHPTDLLIVIFSRIDLKSRDTLLVKRAEKMLYLNYTLRIPSHSINTHNTTFRSIWSFFVVVPLWSVEAAVVVVLNDPKYNWNWRTICSRNWN